VKASLETVPPDPANYFKFNLFVGLGPSEAKSANMLRTTSKYINKDVRVLEHFRYPEHFIRNTRKCFISVADDETLEIAKATRSLDYQGIRSEFRRRKAAFAMCYCRKLFAPYMRKYVDTELVDLLQGRVPTSIFAKYYNRPNYLDELQKIHSCLPELRKLL
jgi:intergrase/recombinase